jgi:hypothetical protein
MRRPWEGHILLSFVVVKKWLRGEPAAKPEIVKRNILKIS